MTRRSRRKRAFPLARTNTCCGHPAPGEALDDAIHRRLGEELNLRATRLRLVLPAFSYRASFDGIEENELCPVFVCRLEGRPRAHVDEVEDWEWWTWQDVIGGCS